MAEWIIALLLVVGAVFGLVGSIGLLRLPDTMQRLHAPTKATTVGVGSALIASALDLWVDYGILSWQEILVFLFLFMTAPITANYLSKVVLHRAEQKAGQRDGGTGMAVPATGVDTDWATFDRGGESAVPVLPGQRDPD